MKLDVVIVGGGIAAVSAAYFLSEYASVALLEREESIGYHSSGRTAEQYTVGIAADTMRVLAKASRGFLDSPPSDFTAERLLTPRGCLTVGREDQAGKLTALYERLASVDVEARQVDGAEALKLFPALRAQGVDVGVYEPAAADIDVNTLLQSYARGAKARGARFVTGAGVTSMRRRGGVWILETTAGTFEASRVLNASGAWADKVGEMAGLDPIGLTPMRRTAFTFAPVGGAEGAGWPHVSNVDYRWYVKPETGRFMGSLADAVPTPPGDVYADDLDVAQAIHNIQQDTTFEIGRPLSKWAGLRNFVADKNPVCGSRPGAEGFFWLAGHGGCGVLTSPALGEAAAAIVLDRALPRTLSELGVRREDLAPDRPSLAAATGG